MFTLHIWLQIFSINALLNLSTEENQSTSIEAKENDKVTCASGSNVSNTDGMYYRTALMSVIITLYGICIVHIYKITAIPL